MKFVSSMFNVFLVVFLTACDTGVPPEVKKSLNYSDNYMHQQMVAAINSLPSNADIERYRHFHISSKLDMKERLTANLYDLLLRPSVDYISLGCDTVSACEEVLFEAVARAMSAGVYFDGLTFIFPEYLNVSRIDMDNLEVKVLVYKISAPNE